jgi:apolipoprotein D and lipocalin family protein
MAKLGYFQTLRARALQILCGGLVVGLWSTAWAQAPVVSVAAVDLVRYSGKWFEIASFPMFFQRNCVADATAQYAAAPDGSISVYNRCRTGSGFDDATGKATVVEGFGNSRLKVSFFWPFKSDYWVLGLDAQYRWAVVGNPNREYLWLLSRTPQLEDALLQDALASARAQGFDLTRLRYTPQAADIKP